jgi:hypothetical protein
MIRRGSASSAILLLVSIVLAALWAGVASAASPVLLGDQSIESLADSNDPGQAEAFPFVAGSSGTAGTVSVYVDSHSSASAVLVGLYTDVNSHPGSLLGDGSTSSPVAGAWNSITVGSASVVAGNTYWVTVLGVGGTMVFRDSDAGSCSSITSAQSGLSSLPAAWSSGSSWPTCSLSAYVSGTTTTPPPSSPPSNTAPPIISGTAQQGDTLTTSNGSWTNSPTSYTYQWQDCAADGTACSNITGATNSTYTITSSDAGDTIVVVVTATNSAGSTSQASSPTGVVPAPPSNTAPPIISGTAQQGDTLTTSNGSWTNSPTSYTYQWQDCDTSGNNCVNAAGSPSTNQTYAIVNGDSGHTIRVVVTATNAGGSASQTSVQTGVVAGGGSTPVLAAEPAVTGTVATGSVLTTTNGSWTNTPTSYTYQWNDCASDGTACSAIGGATSSTYAVAAGDAGHTIQAVVTAHNAAGASTPAPAPTVPLIDNFNGTSVDTNLWTVAGQQGETGQAEPECHDNQTVSGNQLTIQNTYSSGGFTCPTGSAIGTTQNGYTAGNALPSSIPILAIYTTTWPVAAGTCVIFDRNSTHTGHSQTFTTSGASAGSAIPVTSGGTWNYSFASSSYVACPTTLHYHGGAIQETTAFTYGKVVVRAKLPGNQGTTWPSVWMLGAACQNFNLTPPLTTSNTWLTGGGTNKGCWNWPADSADSAEVDLFEGNGTTNSLETDWNTSGIVQQCSPSVTDTSTNFHVYELDWTAGSLIDKIDGTTTCTLTGANVPSHPMFVIIDAAIWPNTAVSSDLPQTFTVDYVHVSH